MPLLCPSLHQALIFFSPFLSLFCLIWILPPAVSLWSRVLSCTWTLPSYFWDFIGTLQSFLWTWTHQLSETLRSSIFSCCSQWACPARRFLVSTCCLFWGAQVSQRPWCFPPPPLMELVPCRSCDCRWFVPSCTDLGLGGDALPPRFCGCFPWGFDFAAFLALFSV